jgi:hypothetical protein
MKLGELVNCALPVLSEYDSDEYPYFFGGTCFLVKHRGDLFVVTARHVLKQKPVEDLRIPRRPSSRTFLTLRTSWTAPDELLQCEDPDQYDWQIVRADWPELDADDPLSSVLDLDAIPSATMKVLPEGYKMVVRGFPTQLSAIAFEAMRIKWQAFAGTGMYVGPASWHKCHTLRLDEPDAVASYDGLSGSPVFVVWPAGEGRFQPALAGIVLRGGNGLLHFLDGMVLRDAIGKCAQWVSSQAW